VRIEGFIADVRSTLSYKNVGKDPIEARYEFPMDDQSAVYQFEAQIEDRVIIAECQEKKKVRTHVIYVVRSTFFILEILDTIIYCERVFLKIIYKSLYMPII